MGFYSKHVLPHLLDLSMRNRETARLRGKWIPRGKGEVLEIGIGSGLNLSFYSPQVRHVYGVDPSIELRRMARKRVSATNIQVDLLAQSAENPLPIASASIDTIVVTWTLCSIPNPSKALLEMKRVLKPNGRLIFLEHGRAPDASVVAWQDRLTPLWRQVSGGCHLNRKIDELIVAGGFRITELETCYMPGPRLMTYSYQGLGELA
jgi:ubiquinone/menaquinone biosynthesis C-methylase UbiE